MTSSCSVVRLESDMYVSQCRTVRSAVASQAAPAEPPRHVGLRFPFHRWTSQVRLARPECLEAAHGDCHAPVRVAAGTSCPARLCAHCHIRCRTSCSGARPVLCATVAVVAEVRAGAGAAAPRERNGRSRTPVGTARCARESRSSWHTALGTSDRAAAVLRCTALTATVCGTPQRTATGLWPSARGQCGNSIGDSTVVR